MKSEKQYCPPYLNKVKQEQNPQRLSQREKQIIIGIEPHQNFFVKF